MKDNDSLTVWWWRNALHRQFREDTDALEGMTAVFTVVFFPLMWVCDLAYVPLHGFFSWVGRHA